MYIAAKNAYIDCIKYLVEIGLPIDKVSEASGCTALGIAAYGGHLNVVKYLQYKGASLIKSDSKGENTPLMLCCKAGQIEIVEYLLNFEEVLNNKNTFEYSPMIYSISSKNERLVSIFLKAKYDIYIKNKNNESILFHAIRTSSNNIIKLLYSTFKALDCENSDTITAFMFAFLEHNFEVVDIMRNFGADVNQKNTTGEKISDIAKRKGDKLIIDYLKNFNLYEPNIDYKIYADTITAAELHTLNNKEYDENFFDLRNLPESELTAPKEPELLLVDNETKPVDNKQIEQIIQEDQNLPSITVPLPIPKNLDNTPIESPIPMKSENKATPQIKEAKDQIKSTVSINQFSYSTEGDDK
jgi:ankyrin repeat protein